MPGTVEFLPAMPATFSKGSIEGIWLYTFAKLEHMEWCETGLKATLTSNKAQTLTLRCRRNISSFRINGTEMSVEGDHILYSFPEGKAVEVEIYF